LTSLLDVLSSVVSFRRLDSNFISERFGSKLHTSKTCKQCKETTSDQGQFSTHLHVAINGESETLEQCLQDYFSCEQVVEEYKCPKCNTIASATERSFMEPRHILIITLKRQKFEKNKGKQSKIESTIAIPLDDLDLSSYAPEEWMEYITPMKYKLVGSINHSGKTTNSGHYVLLMRRNASWMMFNDTEVRPSSDDDLLTENAYTLVYCLEESYGELVETDIECNTTSIS
jgi:ubiquitin C-terminal hydrolase